MKLRVVPNPKNKKEPEIQDYEAKEHPRAEDMEQAEGDREMIETALKNQADQPTHGHFTANADINNYNEFEDELSDEDESGIDNAA